MLGLRACLCAFALVVACDDPGNVNNNGDVDLAGGGNTGVDLAGQPGQCNATDPRSVPATVFATPEAGEKPYVDVLKTATSSIRVMVYLDGYGGIQDTLIAKAKAGVKVQVIFDVGQTANQKYADALTAAGAEVHWSDAAVFQFMHAKYFVVDERAAVVSTGNFSLSLSILKERNFVAQLNDPQDVADLVTLFDADWNKQAPQMSCTRLIVSPINSRERVLAVIDSANKTLVIQSMQFADDDVRAHVQWRQQAGVDVRVLLAAPSWITANSDAAIFLKANNIPVRWLATPGQHVKAIVADAAANGQAYLGSENLSYTSLTKNRETGIVLNAQVEQAGIKTMSDTFEKDWAGATAF